LNLKDKPLRQLTKSYIINDLKKENRNHKNVKLNKKIQRLIYEIIKESEDDIAKRTFMIMIELYKRNIWNDEKTANIIAQGCFNRNWKIVYLACRFLIDSSIGNLSYNHEGEISDEEINELMIKQALGTKKTKKRIRKLKREIANINRKKERKKLKKTIQNFLPIDSIDSAQDFCEKLFQKLKTSSFKIEVKILML